MFTYLTKIKNKTNKLWNEKTSRDSSKKKKNQEEESVTGDAWCCALALSLEDSVKCSFSLLFPRVFTSLLLWCVSPSGFIYFFSFTPPLPLLCLCLSLHFSLSLLTPSASTCLCHSYNHDIAWVYHTVYHLQGKFEKFSPFSFCRATGW